jgi:Mg-chelatase subunit ChlD
MAQPFDPHPCEMVPEGPGAELLQPLTADRVAVREALDRVALRKPGGASNLAAGIRMSVSMLAGLPDTGAPPRPNATRVILFFGHRAPTFPFGSPYHTSPDDIALAERAAKVAVKAGIRLEILAFGTGKGMVLESLARIAALTGGRLTRIADVRNAGFGAGLP